MKVLFAVPYIYDKSQSEFAKNRTGFGMMVYDIFQSVSEKCDAYLLSHVLTKGYNKVLRHKVWDVLRHISFNDIKQALKWFFGYKQSVKGRIRLAYCCLNKGHFRVMVKRLYPDVVHIHGCGYDTKTFIEVCEELNIKYVITLHGLNGIDDSIRIPAWAKAYEKEFIRQCDVKRVPVTVISTGIKNRIEEYYLGKESSSVIVITNGTVINTQETADGCNSLREKLHIPASSKLAVVIGSICEHKNQMQIVEAIHILQNKGITNLCVVFCGVDTTEGLIQKRIKELGLEQQCFMLGFVPHEQVVYIYDQADFNILASKVEGFGLSMIEAFVHGLPTVTFADLDAIPDLYDESAMLLCYDRNTETLANMIETAMNTKWDSVKIKKHGEKYSIDSMAENYIKIYTDMLNN